MKSASAHAPQVARDARGAGEAAPAEHAEVEAAAKQGDGRIKSVTALVG